MADVAHPLRSRALSSTVLTTVGFGFSLAFRLASNIILANLLLPSSFGLLTLVTTFLTGLALFSDVGTRLAIIQHPRGHEPRFLATAFTIQAARGTLLFVVATILAWPMARFYNAPEVLWLIPFVALSTVFQGFTAVGLILANREMRVGRAISIELATQIFTSIVMVVWALYSPTPWSQAVGIVAGAALAFALSHLLLPTPGGSFKFAWDKSSAHEMFKFGKWTFVATALTFLALQADKLILGKLDTLEMLGFYSIAIALTYLPCDLLDRLNGSVLHPYFCSLQRDGMLVQRFAAVREPFAIIGLAMLACLSFLAPLVVDLLYQDNYATVAPLMQVLTFMGTFRILEAGAGMSLLANGMTRSHAGGFAAKLVVMPFLIIAGHMFAGFIGAVAGLALAEGVRYLTGSALARQVKIYMWRRDTPLLLLQGALLFASFAYGAGLIRPALSPLTFAFLGCGLSLVCWGIVAYRRVDPILLKQIRARRLLS
jgi:O-antigen/teichoic acid export membrane protein